MRAHILTKAQAFVLLAALLAATLGFGLARATHSAFGRVGPVAWSGCTITGEADWRDGSWAVDPWTGRAFTKRPTSCTYSGMVANVWVYQGGSYVGYNGSWTSSSVAASPVKTTYYYGVYGYHQALQLFTYSSTYESLSSLISH